MKIFQWNGSEWQGFRDCGALRPFSEASLFQQIVAVAPDITSGESRRLVFSKEEMAQMSALSDLVIGGLQVNRGLGRTVSGIDLLLSPLLQPEGLYPAYIPASGEENVPFGERNWLLSIKRA